MIHLRMRTLIVDDEPLARERIGSSTRLMRETMGGLEARLDPEKFVRIHRSTIVQVDRIKGMQPAFHGDYIVILQDGTRLNLSRSYREKLQALLGQTF